MANKAQVQSRSWCFTINNPTQLLVMDDEVQYLLYQKEIGEKGTPHFQCYMFLRRKKGARTVKELLRRMSGGKKPHFEACKGSHQANVDYCSKEDTRIEGPWEHGSPPEQGKRTDLLSLKSDLDSGMVISDVAERNFSAFIRYHGGIYKYRQLRTEKRTWKTKV